MQEFWNNRYSEEGFAYGAEPNEFLKESLTALKSSGKLLLPAEGEGRNAVYAAQLGWHVTAFDFSSAAQKKALELAGKRGVQLTYLVADVADADLPCEYFDCMA